MFTKIEGAWVILRSRGVYRQADVYDRTHELYARFGGGFIALCGTKSTSKTDVTYEDLDLPKPYKVVRPNVGRVYIKEYTGG